MRRKILILSASARKGGNSERLAEQFEKGATQNGNEVELIRLFDHKIGFCKGCLACQSTQRCVIRDDAVEIADKMKNADILVFATPVYYYSVSGQLKTMLDRANPLYPSAYQFRDIYLLATAAEDEPETVSGTKTAVQGWIDCFTKANLKQVIFAGNVNLVSDIEGHKALDEAYNAGKNVV